MFVPNVVEVEVPTGELPKKFVMSSAHGTDEVARLLWCGGIDGFEYPLPRLFSRLVRDAGVVVGIGANSGVYELIAAVSSNTISIYAFEPYPPAIACLEKNLELNGLLRRIHVVKRAVGDSEGSADLFIPAKQFGDTLETSASLNRAFRPAHSSVISVPICTLDSFVRETSLQRLDILRVDVESMEHLVLAGALGAMENFRPLIILEILMCASTESIERIRSALKYVPYLLCDNGSVVRVKSVTACKASANQVLCPEECVGKFESMASDAGIQIVH